MTSEQVPRSGNLRIISTGENLTFIPSGNLTLAEWISALEICKQRIVNEGMKGMQVQETRIPGFNPKKF